MKMVGGEGGPDRAPRVTRRGLDPEAGKIALAEQLAVGHEIESDPTGQAQVALAGALRDGSGELQHDLLGDKLDRGGEIHFSLRQPLFGLARRTPEQLV